MLFHMKRQQTGLVLLAALVLMGTFCFAQPAFAVDSEAGLTDQEDPNKINTQQVPDSSFLYDTTIHSLSSADATYNNQTVQITGEAIGDLIYDEGNSNVCWVTLSDSTPGKEGSVAVRVTPSQASIIDTYGRYGQTGTILRIKGVFHLACPDDEGLADIHADTVSLVEKGSVQEREFDLGHFIPGIVLLCVGGLLILLFRFLRERLR